jgi:hypothetical protein
MTILFLHYPFRGNVMVAKLQRPPDMLPSPLNEVLPPSTVIHTMIELKIQLYELEQQIKALQPLFYATCAALNTSCLIVKTSAPSDTNFGTP